MKTLKLKKDVVGQLSTSQVKIYMVVEHTLILLKHPFVSLLYLCLVTHVLHVVMYRVMIHAK